MHSSITVLAAHLDLISRSFARSSSRAMAALSTSICLFKLSVSQFLHEEGLNDCSSEGLSHFNGDTPIGYSYTGHSISKIKSNAKSFVKVYIGLATRISRYCNAILVIGIMAKFHICVTLY